MVSDDWIFEEMLKPVKVTSENWEEVKAGRFLVIDISDWTVVDDEFMYRFEHDPDHMVCCDTLETLLNSDPFATAKPRKREEVIF